MGLLELAQLAHQQVELGVGDFGRVQRVIALVVEGDLLPQGRHPGRRVGRRPLWPRSGGDARADHGVGLGDVVKRDRSTRRDRALGDVEAHDQPTVAVLEDVGAGVPWALTCATARSPGRRAWSTHVSVGPGSVRAAVRASAALPTLTRLAGTSTATT